MDYEKIIRSEEIKNLRLKIRQKSIFIQVFKVFCSHEILSPYLDPIKSASRLCHKSRRNLEVTIVRVRIIRLIAFATILNKDLVVLSSRCLTVHPFNVSEEFAQINDDPLFFRERGSATNNFI